MRRHQEGFTLLELVVVMLCTTLVIGAAMTVLLTGLRIERNTQDGLSVQQTAHMVLTLVERLTDDGKVSSVETVGDQDWMLLDEDHGTLLSYNAGAGTLTAGGGAVLMEDVSSATAELSEEKLLTVTLETEGESYTASSLCRTAVTQSAVNQDALLDQVKLTTGDEPGRAALLLTLATQYGSDGRILNGGGTPTQGYFSQWYDPSWSADTPWCACFLSWGLAEIQKAGQETGTTYLDGTPPKFANVDSWMADFRSKEDCWKDETYVPDPGDLVFFDWSGGDDPAHVGAVFYVDEDNGVFYTIEGNSGGRVRLHVYPLGSRLIVGYGILDWKSTEQPTEP